MDPSKTPDEDQIFLRITRTYLDPLYRMANTLVGWARSGATGGEGQGEMLRLGLAALATLALACLMWRLLVAGSWGRRIWGFLVFLITGGGEFFNGFSRNFVVWQETYPDRTCCSAAAFAVQGRRPTMEDRFSVVKIDHQEGGSSSSGAVRLFAVMDGHGGEFAAVYAKKHLMGNLTRKIKTLMLLADHGSFKDKSGFVRTFERTLGLPATPEICRFVGLAQQSSSKGPSSAKSPCGPPNKNDKKCQPGDDGEDGAKSPTEAPVVLSSRVKVLEELPDGEKALGGRPVASTRRKAGSKNPDPEAEDQNPDYCHSDLLSPYSAVKGTTASSAKRGQKRPNEVKNAKKANNSQQGHLLENITAYIKADGHSIDFPRLIKDEVISTDRRLTKEAKEKLQVGGTTLLLAVIEDRTSTMWVANVGDSRGVMSSEGDSSGSLVVPLSYDHKPTQLKERKRIEEAGGFVSLDGVWRVQGILAVSRAMGDFPLKERNYITSEPDILTFNLARLGADFAILATDGLWDTHSNEEAVAKMKSFLLQGPEVRRGGKGSPKYGSSAAEVAELLASSTKDLVMDSYRKGSADNITVITIDLSAFNNRNKSDK